MLPRVKEIYDITKSEIANGADIYEYNEILYGLIKQEDYEACEGIRLAVAEFGLQLIVPTTDDELDYLYEQRMKNMKAWNNTTLHVRMYY